MLFCKSSTVKVGTIAPICTPSCVVATLASLLFRLASFIRRLAGRARIFKRGRAKGVLRGARWHLPVIANLSRCDGSWPRLLEFPVQRRGPDTQFFRRLGAVAS